MSLKFSDEFVQEEIFHVASDGKLNQWRSRDSREEVRVVCDCLEEHAYSLIERDALADMYMILGRKLTHDEVERVLFLVSLDSYFESIPF